MWPPWKPGGAGHHGGLVMIPACAWACRAAGESPCDGALVWGEVFWPGRIARAASVIQSVAIMRIATWNLERPDPADVARNQARMEKIREIDADVWILTETHEVIDLSASHHGAATAPSPRKPLPGEACASVWSRWPILRRIETADPTEAVCVEVAHPEGPLLVYGSIIAYAGYKGPDGMSRMRVAICSSQSAMRF